MFSMFFLLVEFLLFRSCDLGYAFDELQVPKAKLALFFGHPEIGGEPVMQ